LEYTKTPYTDKHYTSGEEWAKDKSEKPMDFPNVPYINKCGVYYTESSALIMLVPVIAKQPQLLGGNDEDRVRVHQLLGVLKDVYSEMMKICYSKKEDFEGLKAAGTEKTIRPKYALLEKFLGKKDWLLGYVTVADIFLFYQVDLLTAMDAKILEGFDGLKGLHKRFSEIPQIAAYRASGRLPKGWNGMSAAWGSSA
jgi:glutathione S-transferase